MSTTPADILNQLQNAWGALVVAPPPAKPTSTTTQPKQTTTGVLLTGKTEPCRGHPQPLQTIDEPDELRPGWIRSRCQHCRRFLGYRRDK